jgi:acyl carrier protein
MNCPFCESPLAPGTKFCPHCGTDVTGGPPPAGYHPYGPPQYGPMPPPTSSLAITSLVAGLVGWFLVPIIGALVAVVTGHMARAEIRTRRGELSGDGLAVTGLILGYIQLVLAALVLLAVLAFFGFAVSQISQSQPKAMTGPPPAAVAPPAAVSPAAGDDVGAQVIRIVGAQMGVPEEQVTPGTSLAEDLGVDELDHAEIMLRLEEAFQVAITAEEAEQVQTVGQAIDLIEAKRAAPAGGESAPDGPPGDAPEP